MTQPIITRTEARAAGLKRYFTGKPCKHGHVLERITASGSCVECARRIEASYRERNPDAYSTEKMNARLAAWSAANPDKEKARQARKRAKRRAQHPEKVKAQNASWYARNREKMKAYYTQHKEKMKTARAARYAKNPEKAKAAWAAYRTKNPERVKANHKAWVKANREKCTTKGRNYVARKQEAEGSHTKEDIRRILAAQNGKCACCKTAVNKKYHVDHIQPLTKGGSNRPSNLQILCPFCNVSKSNRDPIEFMQSRGMLL